MTRKAREIETLALTAFAAVPLYATQVITLPPLIVFHAVMLGIGIRVAMGKGPELIPSSIMRAIAVAYIVFYVIDAALLSRSAIAASTHLILFIAAYQPIESVRARNHAQRLLTTSLIFIASIATATHISILPFVIVFTFLMFRQLMYVSHIESVHSVDAHYAEPPSARAAAFYLAGTALVGALLFPALPRVRNPLMPGFTGPLTNASTGLSESIDFNQQRTGTTDSTVVSRVWMGPETVPFFTPLRLKGAIYERFRNNEWRQGRRDFVPLDMRDGSAHIAKPAGFTRRAVVQQRFIVGTRLFLPVGTYQIDGLPQIYEGPTKDVYMTWQTRGDLINYDVHMARETLPRVARKTPVTNYPVTPPVAALARQIVGTETDARRQARLIEQYMSTKFQYVADPQLIGRRTMSVDEFLLRERRGHCEYFAAGMVALMTSLNVPARIVGGFYGGKLNPLTGYFIVRRQDAHAWVEIWSGRYWETFDPTPVSLRPGNTQQGLLRVYASALSDSINYFWDRYILTFGLGDQIALMTELFTRARTAAGQLRETVAASGREMLTARYLALMSLVIAMGGLIFWIQLRRRPIATLLTEELRRLGIEMTQTMTMEEALARLRMDNPDAATRLAPLVRLYEEERFSAVADPKRTTAIRRALRELREA